MVQKPKFINLSDIARRSTEPNLPNVGSLERVVRVFSECPAPVLRARAPLRVRPPAIEAGGAMDRKARDLASGKKKLEEYKRKK